VFRQLKGDNSWEKTEHSGAHRDSADAPTRGERSELVGATTTRSTPTAATGTDSTENDR